MTEQKLGSKLNNKLNGNVRMVVTFIAIVIIGIGWGATWGTLRGEVSAQSAYIAELKTDKLSADVYRADIKLIENKIDNLKTSLDRIEKNVKILTDRNNPDGRP